MKNIFIVAITLLAFSCKKEKTEVSSNPVVVKKYEIQGILEDKDVNNYWFIRYYKHESNWALPYNYNKGYYYMSGNGGNSPFLITGDNSMKTDEKIMFYACKPFNNKNGWGTHPDADITDTFNRKPIKFYLQINRKTNIKSDGDTIFYILP